MKNGDILKGNCSWRKHLHAIRRHIRRKTSRCTVPCSASPLRCSKECGGLKTEMGRYKLLPSCDEIWVVRNRLLTTCLPKLLVRNVWSVVWNPAKEVVLGCFQSLQKIDISGVFQTSALEMMSILHWGNSQSCEPSISPIDSKISSGKLLYEGIGDTVPLIFLMISFGCSIYRNFRVLSQVWKVFSESYAAGLCHYAMFLYKWPPISQANPEDLAVPLCRKRKSQRESFVIFQE